MSTPAVWLTLLGGAEPHDAAVDDELRGVGIGVTKSAGFESVSVQPSPARTAAVVLLSAATAPEPS